MYYDSEDYLLQENGGYLLDEDGQRITIDKIYRKIIVDTPGNMHRGFITDDGVSSSGGSN